MTSYVSGATHGAHLTAFTSKLPFYNLFEFWRVQTVTELVVSCVVLFLLGLGHEFLKSVQISHGKCHVPGRDVTDSDVTCFDKEASSLSEEYSKRPAMNVEQKMSTLHHLANTILYCVVLAWSYLLMLSVMTMNPWLAGSSVLGCSTGFMIFGVNEKSLPNSQTVEIDNNEKSDTNRSDKVVELEHLK
uniref:high affinity copper uptake protein 1-like isoform X2 n=1 Tax=Ciona intestinalis TaxID=7719 RepID=UPI0002B8E347|nr:high affinity copper uptake protein 1-like isoform X2 [Ciona intestinalis]|eukprot:XP_004226252.3 high affinity copper uptake protein 1-like isoform X2 [Ciona intestinalis]